MSTTATGQVGAGSTALQASCTAAAVVTPGAATWNATDQKFQYTTVDVTGTFTACDGQTATVNVYALTGGAPLSSGTHLIDTGTEAAAFEVTITKVDADIVNGDYKYGLVIQSAS